MFLAAAEIQKCQEEMKFMGDHESIRGKVRHLKASSTRNNMHLHCGYDNRYFCHDDHKMDMRSKDGLLVIVEKLRALASV